MIWKVFFSEEAKNDIDELDFSQRIQVIKAIRKVSLNPLPQNEGGYGKPLGNTKSKNLTGILK